MKKFLAFAMCMLLLPSAVLAQMGTEQSRRSLTDIRGFYVQVDVEGSVGLTSDEQLNASAINQRVKNRLRAAGLNVLEPTEVLDQPTEPYLYVHINMMELDGGMVPFATNLQFFQRVELPDRRRKQSLIACTWDTGVVGLVYFNSLNLIPESTEELVNEFIADFQVVNP